MLTQLCLAHFRQECDVFEDAVLARRGVPTVVDLHTASTQVITHRMKQVNGRRRVFHRSQTIKIKMCTPHSRWNQVRDHHIRSTSRNSEIMDAQRLTYCSLQRVYGPAH